MCAVHFDGLLVIGPPAKLEMMISALESGAFNGNFHLRMKALGRKETKKVLLKNITRLEFL